MARIEKFEDLTVLREAVSIGVEVYNLTSTGKSQSDLSVKGQLRRGALSISNNKAEEFEYNNCKMFLKFLGYAKASVGELRSNLYVLKEAKMATESDKEQLQSKLLTSSKNISGL